jgi:putative spermidine/putrescine transport system ATP-binding protein
MTVEGNVEYGLRVRGMPAADRAARVREMLAMMRIEPLAARRIDQLSGGQRQRVALARAIAPRPRVLLLDEPLTALDARLREDLRLEIDRLLRSLGITSVYVTHDQAEAMALGDRIAVMSQGRIAQVGTPEQVYFEPADAFVADFIGTMNRVEGVVADGALRFAGGRLPLPDGHAVPFAMFRPEDLRLVDAADAHFAARVVSAFFLGDHLRLVVDAGADAPLVAKLPPRAGVRPGDVVHFAIDAASIAAPAQILSKSGSAKVLSKNGSSGA